MLRISACVISYDEEDKIEDCLRSLRPVADEIVVVDSHSTDRTVEIARGVADRVVDQPFLGYVAQKNFAVSLATHDWVVSLDCDERLSDELREAILAVKQGEPEAAAFEVSRRTFWVYRWLDHCWYPDRRVRLFDRRRARWGGTDPHDRVVVESGRTARLSGDILHLSFDSVSDHLRTLDRFTDIAAREILATDRRVRPWTPPARAAWTFARMYVLRGGFRDGFAGLAVAVLSATHAFVKYAKVLVARRSGPGPLRKDR